MNKLKQLMKHPRIIILIIALLLAFIAIGYQFNAKGVSISSVEQNSTAFLAGMKSPAAEISQVDREKIIEINRRQVNNLGDYNTIMDSVLVGNAVTFTTTEGSYAFIKLEGSLGLTLTEAHSSNLRKGLDLQGGTRVLLKPVEDVTESQIKDIIATMEQRLNVYGLTDLTIKSAADLEGKQYIVIEIAGVTKEEVKDIVAEQGKFEAKIGNETVFEGKDVTFVCRTGGNCVNLVNPSCPISGNGRTCRFEFEVHLSPKAADKHQEITKNLNVVVGTTYLEKNIDFYLDGQQVDSLSIDKGLKGIKASRITISGSGSGESVKKATRNAIDNKNKLQTFLITGSLPTKLEIEKVDTLSPSLGSAFITNALLVGLLSVIMVSLIIYIRYRTFKISGLIILTMLSEIYLILGFAALFKQNLDLAAIAGIIASVGTGVDDQIVIIDEIKRGAAGTLKQSIKKAFFVIIVAYATTVAAMLPLLRAGAGLLTGFAVVTIIGVTIGILITRPAFAAILKVLME